MRPIRHSMGTQDVQEGLVLDALPTMPVEREVEASALAREAMAQHRQLLHRLHHELHDLCQPLTALQCRLEVGRLQGDEAAMQEALTGGLEEAGRLFEVVARMRNTLQQGDAVERGWALRSSREPSAGAPDER